ncbi:MAG: ferritin family protein [bacterium]
MSNVSLLETAMLKEVATADFYREVAERIGNAAGKSKFMELSREEENHLEALKRWYAKETGGKKFNQDTACQPLDYSFPQQAVFDGASALEAISVGISAEKESIDLYTSFRQEVADEEAVKTLERLIEFEKGHLRRLQQEYDAVLNHFYWL